MCIRKLRLCSHFSANSPSNKKTNLAMLLVTWIIHFQRYIFLNQFYWKGKDSPKISFLRIRHLLWSIITHLQPTVLFMLLNKIELRDATACFSLKFQQALLVKIWIMNKYKNTSIFIREKKSILELMRRIRKHLTVVTIERGFLWRLM